MRVIVFDRELHEPLTVVEVPAWLAEQAKDGHPIRLLPPQPFDPSAMFRDEPTEAVCEQIVTLTFERVSRSVRASPRLQAAGVKYESEILFWYAYADDPETALLLRAAFLPGQVGEVQRREKRAYVMGLLGVDPRSP